MHPRKQQRREEPEPYRQVCLLVGTTATSFKGITHLMAKLTMKTGSFSEPSHVLKHTALRPTRQSLRWRDRSSMVIVGHTSHLTDLRDDRPATTNNHSNEQLFIHPNGPRCCFAPQHTGMRCDTRGATYRALGVDGSSDDGKMNACAVQARQGVKSWVHICSFIRVYLLQVAGSDPVESPRLSYQYRPTLTTLVVIPTLHRRPISSLVRQDCVRQASTLE